MPVPWALTETPCAFAARTRLPEETVVTMLPSPPVVVRLLKAASVTVCRIAFVKTRCTLTDTLSTRNPLPARRLIPPAPLSTATRSTCTVSGVAPVPSVPTDWKARTARRDAATFTAPPLPPLRTDPSSAMRLTKPLALCNRPRTMLFCAKTRIPPETVTTEAVGATVTDPPVPWINTVPFAVVPTVADPVTDTLRPVTTVIWPPWEEIGAFRIRSLIPASPERRMSPVPSDRTPLSTTMFPARVRRMTFETVPAASTPLKATGENASIPPSFNTRLTATDAMLPIVKPSASVIAI